MNLSTWVLHGAQCLTDSGSWSGRTHLQKLLYLSELAGASQPFEFDLYRFGPYSFEVDSLVRELEACGLLERKSRVKGYGASYEPRKGWESIVPSSLSGDDARAVERVAKWFGDRKSSDLELIATCHWVEQDQPGMDDSMVIELVGRYKPKYTSTKIAGMLEQLRKLKQSVASSTAMA